jgi:hypothetical protein
MSTLHSFAGHGRVYVGSGAVTTTDLAAAGEEDLTISDSNVALGDIIFAAFDKTAAEGAGEPIIAKAWASAAGTITVTVANLHASTAIGATAKTVNYVVIRAS